MELHEYLDVRDAVLAADPAYEADYDWAETVQPVSDPDVFFWEYVWVLVNSGMHHRVARGIYLKVRGAVTLGQPATSVFGHPGKAAAIDRVNADRVGYFDRYVQSSDQLAFLAGLPWIGPITKYHLAKNFGLHQYAKPDRHLERLAARYCSTPQALCERLAAGAGERVGTVDYILWRAVVLGLLSTRELSVECSPAAGAAAS